MIHCQNCTTRNALEREFCWKCGSKLLVTSGAVPLDSAIPFMEEHVLERISALEYSINILTKRVDSLMETIERVAASNFIDHTMIETLTDSLETAGIDLTNLEAEWRKRIDSRILETEEVDRLGNRMQRIMESYRGSDRKQFGLWIEKSYDLFVSDRSSESLHFLKAAFEHDPANHELGLLLAEVYFQEKEYAKARECLSQVLKAHPNHFEATFLMGLIQQRKGHLQEAQATLEMAVGLKKDSSAAHASLGSLLAAVGKKQQAITHLNTALKLKPSAPVHFLIGAVYYGAGQHKRAIQHLKQATKLDPQFGEAHYQLGLLCLEMNWLRKAQECFKTAQALNPRESRYRKRVRSFSEDATGPDQLNRLIRDELLLVKCASSKRTK
ncbi:MAG TPA: tetratricopeptide repeat protein [Terriglobia bacterium]|nr:tetratricopeptide repeat protein [Terriglobia bacterium]